MDNEELKRQGIESFLADEELHKASRIERFVELNELFKPQGDQLLIGDMQSQFALHELANSYVGGNYMAVVLLVQAFIEHSLSSEFIILGQNTIAESSFKKILNNSLNQDIISEELYNSLEKLRKIRNSYVHAKFGIKSNSPIKKMIDTGFDSTENLVSSDALESLSILKFFMEQKVITLFYKDKF